MEALFFEILAPSTLISVVQKVDFSRLSLRLNLFKVEIACSM